MSDSGDVRIDCQSISKSFGNTLVLDSLDWQIPRGAVIGLLGVNGSGKSTLLRCLLGLLHPDRGQIQIDGSDAWDLPDDVKARLGYVDQQPRMYPWMSGQHLLNYFGSFYPNWDQSLLNQLAARWSVPLEQRFGSLSPGQQQKVAILSALGNQPDLLILDEPVSSMDPIARREFLRSLLEYAADENRTILFSTHITSDLERVASHVAILTGGKIGWFDELDGLKDRVKRIRVHAQSQLPPTTQIPGAIRVDRNGTSLTAVIDSHGERINELRSSLNADLQVEDLNLEEIFLELHRGAAT